MSPKKAIISSQGTVNNVILARTSVLCNGEMATYKRGTSHHPSSRTSSSLPGDLTTVNDHIYALNDLQYSRDTPIHCLGLHYSIVSIIRGLPESVINSIYVIPPTDSDDLFGTDHAASAAVIEKEYAKVSFHPDHEAEPQRRRLLFEAIREREYVFWSINSEGDGDRWVTLIMHIEKSKYSNCFDRVSDFAIVDASRDPAAGVRVARVEARVRHIFALGDITFNESALRRIWVPPQEEDKGWESGLRSFQLVKQLLFRITDTHCKQLEYDDDHFFEATSGWLNVDFLRHEMIGLAAERCNDAVGWSCRYALEPIAGISDPDRSTDQFEAKCLQPVDDDKDAYIPDGDDMTTTDSSVEEDLGGGDSSSVTEGGRGTNDEQDGRNQSGAGEEEDRSHENKREIGGGTLSHLGVEADGNAGGTEGGKKYAKGNDGRNLDDDLDDHGPDYDALDLCVEDKVVEASNSTADLPRCAKRTNDQAESNYSSSEVSNVHPKRHKATEWGEGAS
jgi:hypothetical protein